MDSAKGKTFHKTVGKLFPVNRDYFCIPPLGVITLLEPEIQMYRSVEWQRASLASSTRSPVPPIPRLLAVLLPRCPLSPKSRIKRLLDYLL